MLFLDVLTILCTGLMIGNELAVSLFVNPVIWQLEDGSQAKALSLFAGILGKVMPFWYAWCLTLMIAETYLLRHRPGLTLLLIAVVIWIAIIVYTVTTLVPINNRIARLADALPEGWRQEHKRWDTYHRWRILSLVIAMVCLVWGILMA
ncbi:MAG: hypothetical protein QOH35_4444 [Acidobacteriaceae bacterium]|nr:hypothetical protein [Acidobacteriaceae bacterium]